MTSHTLLLKPIRILNDILHTLDLLNELFLLCSGLLKEACGNIVGDWEEGRGRLHETSLINAETQ
ncbi:unnamed protein product [Spodoptera exigua]|nr:unnamed protein product [Spodoptera exigua]